MMKKTVLAAALVGILSMSSVFAADSEAVKQKVEQLKTEFSLSDQQSERITNIITRASMTEDEMKAKHDAKMAEHMDKRLERMKEKLSLTDEQVTKLKAMMTEHKAKMDALHTEGQAQMTSILTPEQAAKMKEMRGGHMGMGGMGMGHGEDGSRGHHRGGHGGGHGDSCDKDKGEE